MRIHPIMRRPTRRTPFATMLALGLITASTANIANAACTYTVTNSWGAGFTAAIRITNDTTATVNNWQVSWTYANNKVSNSWNALVNGNYTATNIGWNGTIRPGQSVEFGLQGTTNGSAIETPQIQGTLCANTNASSAAQSSNSVSSLVRSSTSVSRVSSSRAALSSSVRSSSSSAIPTGTNIATLATATTSYVSPWETLSAVNDNSTPTNSNDKSKGAYGNWNNPNSIQWVQYDWPQNYSLTSTQIYWFDDNGGVLTPTRAYVEYWSGSNWVSAGDVPLMKDAFNNLPLNGVVTNRIRVSMLNNVQSTGLLEWRVAGTAIGQPASSSSSSRSNIASSASSSSAPGNCTGPLAGTKGTNPLLPAIFTADPAPMVHNCTFYIAAGHDEGTTGFFLRDWYVLSSTDMVNWTDNGAPVMSLSTFTWADSNAWAGQMVHRAGKFYWYVPVNKRGGGMAIGVAVANSPLGPFKDAIGAPLVDDVIEMKAFNYTDAGQTVYTIDPTVFVDDDGQAYLTYGGFWRMVTVALNENMISLKGAMIERTPRDFFEAPYLTKRNGIYYMVYAAGSNPATIDYATSTSPTGPWTYRGRIMEKLPALAGQDAPTSHPAIAEFAGQWYLVYHISNGKGGGTYRRQVAVDKLTFNADGTIRLVTPSAGLSF
ncbi:MAG: family 43 glycosylhydrolase [Cellvibrio sp.]|uniref:family 43 glycosylhydrolase n=1 Tax=Cellvibrio sp. TaxID=1965322 RepID=UPI0027290F54|nr:family 43 glycosylhydrolase [Cellvibrio sp.]